MQDFTSYNDIVKHAGVTLLRLPTQCLQCCVRLDTTWLRSGLHIWLIGESRVKGVVLSLV